MIEDIEIPGLLVDFAYFVSGEATARAIKHAGQHDLSCLGLGADFGQVGMFKEAGNEVSEGVAVIFSFDDATE